MTRRVITLDNNQFEKHCRRLENLVADNYCPDAVVAIASGGVFVGDNMFDGVPHFPVSVKRPSTAAKNKLGFAMRVVRRLPLSIRNAMRVAESRWLELKNRRRSEQDYLSPLSIDVSALSPFKKILVVDDAVDSGTTLRRVLEALHGLPGDRDIRSAVITVTTASASAKPDYFIYDNFTLIRFPWSADNRAK